MHAARSNGSAHTDKLVLLAAAGRTVQAGRLGRSRAPGARGNVFS